jgi:hypothetical protein
MYNHNALVPFATPRMLGSIATTTPAASQARAFRGDALAGGPAGVNPSLAGGGAGINPSLAGGRGGIGGDF